MITALECPECKATGQEWTTSHKTPVVARRALAFHRFKLHGVRSEKAIQEAERKARLAASGGVPAPRTPVRRTLEELGPCPPVSEVKARSNWMKTRWRIMHPDRVEQQRARYALKRQGKSENHQREQLQKSSWWQVADQGPLQPLKLDKCPHCGASFLMHLPETQTTTQ